MGRYVVRRLLYTFPTLVGVLLLTFFLFRLLPTDVAADRAGPGAPRQVIDELRWAYGLDKPLVFGVDAARRGEWAAAFDSQLVHHMRSALTLDFGRSWRTKQDVWATIKRGVGPSLTLTAPIFFGTLVLSISLGMFAALQRGKAWDRALIAISVMGMNLPLLSFVIIGQYLFAYRLGWYPIHGFEGPRYLLLPVAIGVAAGLGGNVRLYRAILLEELGENRVLTARAKGLGPGRVLLAHVLRNALAPIATRVVLALPFLTLGSLLLERFFGIPGVGSMMVEAITSRDYPVVSAMTLIVAVLFMSANLLTDVCYAWLDPRVTLT